MRIILYNIDPHSWLFFGRYQDTSGFFLVRDICRNICGKARRLEGEIS